MFLPTGLVWLKDIPYELENDVNPVFLNSQTVSFALRKATDLEME